MERINFICQCIAGGSFVLAAISFSWVIVRVLFTGDIGFPPAGLWLSLFGVAVAGSIWLGAKLLIDGSLS